MRAPGSRVGAILGSKAESKTIEFLGYGVYEGDFVPIDAAGWYATPARELGLTNPKIKLDNGDVVWGCECWWGGEEAVRTQLQQYADDGWSVVEIRIADARAAA